MANLSNINNKFIVTDGGNVLIGGNISGSSILQVTGNSTFTGNITTLADKRISIGTWDNSAFTSGNAYGFYVDSATPMLILDESGESKTGYVGLSGGIMYVGGIVTSLIMQTGATGANALTIDSDQNSIFTGTVGIGGAASVELQVNASSGYAETRLVGASGSGGTLEFYDDTTKLADIYADPAKKLYFRTNGQTTALTLDDGQNAAFTGRVSIQGDRINFTNASASSIPKIFTNETETGTGLMRIQAGGISGSYGGGITLYANAHASKPGDVVAGLSGGASAAKFRVNLNGVDTGADVFTVNRSGNGIFTGSVTATSFIGTLPTGQFLPIANPTFTGTLTGPKIFAHGVANVIELKQLSAGSATYYVMDNTIETGGKNWRFGYTGCSSDKGSFSICNTTDDVMSLFLDSSGNATVIGNITASGTSSILNTGNSGTFVTNDANDYPRISTSTANIQLGLFRTGSGSGGVYIGGFSGGFEVRNGSSLAPIFNVNQSGTVTLTGDKTINTNSSLRLNAGGGTLFLDSTTNIILRTGGTSPALTLSSSQNVTLNSATALDFQVEDFAQIKFRESGAITIDSDNDQANRNFSIKDGSGTNLLLVLDTGDVTATGDVIAFSDKKLKKNIKTLDGSKVYKMRGVSFDRIDTDKASSGVIAQEMQEIAPELVNESEGTLGVAYGNLTGYLIEAIKELEARIKILENK